MDELNCPMEIVGSMIFHLKASNVKEIITPMHSTVIIAQ